MTDSLVSEISETSDVLPEAMRMAYLQAMGIEQWTPKSEQALDEEKEDSQNLQNPQDHDRVINQVNHSNIDESNNESESVDESKNQLILEKDTTDETAQPTNRVIVSPLKMSPKANDIANEANLETNKNIKTNKILKTSKYLKLVNWTNQNIREENSKKLLIICRHQIDQPANSFARQNSPSQFMLDYINALIGLTAGPSFELRVQLAHLSEAGLGNDSIAMDEVLDDSKPDLVLILGDETAAHLLDQKADVASLRGRLVSLGQNQNAMVSYHPYSLIENSGLKSLALDDLTVLANYLLQNSRT